MEIDLVVTRHAALVALAIERGIVRPGTPVLEHATAADVKGKHVFGVLPLDLASRAKSVTIIPLNLRPEDRGKDLNLKETRERADSTRRFRVEEW